MTLKRKMASTQEKVLQVFFDIGSTKEAICSFVPSLRHQVIEDVDFWLKEGNHDVLSRMKPPNFCDGCERDWSTSDGGTCWFIIHTPKFEVRDVMNFSEKCQQVIVEKLQQFVTDCEKKAERNRTDPQPRACTFVYDVSSVVEFINEFRFEKHIQKVEKRFQDDFGHFLVHHVVPFKPHTLVELMRWLNYHEHDDHVKDHECLEQVDVEFVAFDDKCPPKVQVTKKHRGCGKKACRKQLQETPSQKQKKVEMRMRKRLQRRLSVLKRNRCVRTFS